MADVTLGKRTYSDVAAVKMDTASGDTVTFELIPDVTYSTQTNNGITTHIYRWGNLVLVYWDGAPTTTMNVETWYTIAEGLPAGTVDAMQLIYISCFKWYEYGVQIGNGTVNKLNVYPRGGALTSQDRIRGQMLYFTNDEVDAG